MELANRGSLRSLMRKYRDGIPLKLFWDLAMQIAAGINKLHSSGMMHRDIKTGNVLIDDQLHAKICDFGIATRFGMQHTADVGTTRYMAPEVLFGPYDERADMCVDLALFTCT